MEFLLLLRFIAAFHFTCQVFSGIICSLEPHLIRPTARWTEQTVFKTLRRRVYGYSDNDYFYLKVGLKQSQICLNPTKLMAGPIILSMRTAFSLFFSTSGKNPPLFFEILLTQSLLYSKVLFVRKTFSGSSVGRAGGC